MATTITNEKIQKGIRQAESMGCVVAGPESRWGSPGIWQVTKAGKTNIASVHIHPDGEARGFRLFKGKGCYSDWGTSEEDIIGAFWAAAEWAGLQ